MRRIARSWRNLALILLSPVLVREARGQARTIEPPKPLETMVWANSTTQTYHCPGTQYYGNTQEGEYMSEAAARARGNRAVGRTACPPIADPATPLRPSTPGQVWINTESGLYHCPDTKLYGHTKRGRFLPESDARARGHRPAARRVCG